MNRLAREQTISLLACWCPPRQGRRHGHDDTTDEATHSLKAEFPCLLDSPVAAPAPSFVRQDDGQKQQRQCWQ